MFNQCPEQVWFGINETFERGLHVAVSAENTKLMEDFLQNMVDRMEKEDLELENYTYNTTFCLATATGSAKMAEIMVNKNKALLIIPGDQEMMPLYIAASFANHDMAKYLYDVPQKMTDDFWTTQNWCWVLLKCVKPDIFDVALKIVTDHPELASSGTILEAWARKPDAFNRIKRNIIWRVINSIFAIKVGPAEKDSQALKLLRIIGGNTMKMPEANFDDIYRGAIDPANENEKEQYSSRILFVAETGNTRFVIEPIRAYPDLIQKVNDEFHLAVMHRHEGIYNLLYEVCLRKDLIAPLKDQGGNNMLHLVGMTPKKTRFQIMSGVSLLMQQELLWFKEVEKMIRRRKNKDGLMPYEFFSEDSKDLVFQGLKWMKDRMVVAALIVTILFAVAFTVSGGYNQEWDSYHPMFICEGTFLVFVLADAISLFS